MTVTTITTTEIPNVTTSAICITTTADDTSTTANVNNNASTATTNSTNATATTGAIIELNQKSFDLVVQMALMQYVRNRAGHQIKSFREILGVCKANSKTCILIVKRASVQHPRNS